MAEVIFYNSSDVTGQSQLSKAVSLLKYPDATVYDTAGLDAAAMTALIDAITVDTIDDVCVCNQTASTHAAGKFTYDDLAYMRVILKTAKKGTVIRASNTCQSNATTTEIILDSGASADDDAYNGYGIVTAGATVYHRYISNYVGTTTTATVIACSPAVTSTDTFIVFSFNGTDDHVHVMGDASSNKNACRVAWDRLFDGTPPLLIQLMGGYGSGFKAYELALLTADSFTSTTLVDSSAFTASKYTGLGCAVGIISASSAGAGQVRKIISNTANALTVTTWDVTPSGTVTYQVSTNGALCLYNYYMPLAIATYLSANTAAEHAILMDMLDWYRDAIGGKPYTYQDLATLDSYAAKGKAIYDAKCMGVVS